MVGTAMWMTTRTANIFLASLFFAAVPQTLDSRLIDAARQGHPETVKILADAGAPVDERDNFGWTVLMRATLQGQAGSVKALIEAGADVNLKDQSGRTALTHALSGGHEEAVEMLKKAGAR